MKIQQQIEEILRSSFKPQALEVLNESYRHAGHMGDDGSGESHFKLIITGGNFTGTTRIAKHREVISALSEIMKQVHAMEINFR